MPGPAACNTTGVHIEPIHNHEQCYKIDPPRFSTFFETLNDEHRHTERAAELLARRVTAADRAEHDRRPQSQEPAETRGETRDSFEPSAIARERLYDAPALGDVSPVTDPVFRTEVVDEQVVRRVNNTGTLIDMVI
ncbi:MAG: hypothetical protein AAFU70_11690 [Planctomycetota bacterium]